AVFGAAAGELGVDAPGPYQVAVLVVVVGTVGVERVGSATGPSASTSHRGNRLDQRDELGDVVAVATGQRHRQRDTATLADHMVLRSVPGPIDWAGTGFRPPFNARTWEPSAAARDQSISPAALSLASSNSCSRGHTPASVQSRSRRQQVMPEPYPSSCGKNSHGMPVYSTNKMPY